MKSFHAAIPVELWKPINSIDSLIAKGTPRNGARSSVHSSGNDLCPNETASSTRSISCASFNACANRSST